MRRTPSRAAPKTELITALIGCVLLSGCAVLPEPISETARLERVQLDIGQLYADQEPLRGPLTLHEAVARGLKYNLDRRLKIMETALADARRRHARLDMLPRLVAQAGYRGRDPIRASSSRSILSGLQSLEVSTSEDKEIKHADLQLVWNVLDFGLSYIRAQQEADRVLIARERRIKVAQNMVLDIRDAYWRALAAQRILPRVNELLARIRTQVAKSRRLMRSGDGEPEQELDAQRRLLEHSRDLEEVRRRLTLARSELAALINLPPTTKFRLKTPGGFGRRIPHLHVGIAELEHAALTNRPELREEDYKKRISQREVRAAYVRMLPGIELRIGRNYDSNSFLFSSNWNNIGGLVTKNLIELATAPVAIDLAETEVQVADSRRLALSMAVIAQVHISLQRYGLARQAFTIAEKLRSVNRELSQVVTRGASGDGLSQLAALEAQSRAVVSQIRAFTAYADLQNAYGRILNSAGANRFPEDIDQFDVKALTAQLRNDLDRFVPVIRETEVAAK